MSDINGLFAICKKLNSIVEDEGNFDTSYVVPRVERDVLLTGCVFLAVREDRIFQISIQEDTLPADAFFKSTGLQYEERLLQLIYAFDSVNYNEAVALFRHWIIDWQDEEAIKSHNKVLFGLVDKK